MIDSSPLLFFPSQVLRQLNLNSANIDRFADDFFDKMDKEKKGIVTFEDYAVAGALSLSLSLSLTHTHTYTKAHMQSKIGSFFFLIWLISLYSLSLSLSSSLSPLSLLSLSLFLDLSEGAFDFYPYLGSCV